MAQSFITAIILSLFFISCVDEPEIDPVKTPYSAVRVANFTNVDNVDVYIDGNKELTLGMNQVSNYFDLTSGTRRYTLIAAGDTLFDKELTAISYEESTVFFAGFYNGTKEDISFRSYSDGRTYVTDGVAGGDTASVVLINLVHLNPTDSLTVGLDLDLEGGTNDTSVTSNLAALLDRAKHTIIGGQFTLSTALTDKPDVADTVSESLDGGKRNYVYVYGDLNNVDIKVEKLDPLPARSK